MTNHQFHELLHLIYEAGIDKTQWPAVLNTFIKWLGSPSGHLSMITPNDPENSIVYEANIDPGFGAIYESRIIDDPWFQGAASLTTGSRFVDRELCLPKLYQQSDYYHEVAAHCGIDWCVGGIILRNSDHNVVITGNGPRDFKGFDDHSKELVGLILPHINRAYRFNQQLFGLNNMVGTLKQGLDSLSAPIALLDNKGLVCYMNANFERVIRSQTGLSLSDRRLLATKTKEQRQLDRLISMALKTLADPELIVDLGLRINREGGDNPFNLIISPVRNRSGVGGIHSQARLIVTLSDYDKPPVPSVDLLETLYGLSRNQARLAKCLMSDMSVNEAADVLGIKVTTARSYLKEILSRTETNSQNSLLLKLSRIAL